MVNNRTCIISCPTFWGYKKIVDLDTVDSNDEIIAIVLDGLNEQLKQINLIYLIEILEKYKKEKKYGIHTNFTDLLLSEEIIYVCNH